MGGPGAAFGAILMSEPIWHKVAELDELLGSKYGALARVLAFEGPATVEIMTDVDLI